MPSASTIFVALCILVPLLLILSIIRAFRDAKKEKTILCHIQILRRSIGAAFLLGFIIMCYSQSRAKGSGDWNYGGPLLLFVSAIHYGYARKAERAAIALENQK
ncbi:MAG: hypothetical protein WC661_21850 [Opitutaceae bacterium]|jgi:hypothetical protein